MCLIVETNNRTPMTKAFIENVIIKNNDGWGMMYIDEKPQVRIHKEKKCNLEEIITAYEAVKHLNPIVHFRMRTHGEVDSINAHPYYCGHQTWLMHNGVLHSGNKKNEKYSDTWHFIEDVIKPLLNSVKDPEEFIFNPVFKRLITEYIGYSNKMVFMNRKGPAFISQNGWHEITEPGTNMVGIYVSNTYAWDEKSFDPNKKKVITVHQNGTTFGSGAGGTYTPSQQTGTLSKNQLKKLRKKQEREAKRTGNISVVSTPSDWFRRENSGLEHVYDDYYLDTQMRVWKKGSFGWSRCSTLEYSDIYAIMQNDAYSSATRRSAVAQGGGIHSQPQPTITEVREGVDITADNSEDEYAETEISIAPIPTQSQPLPALLKASDFNLSEKILKASDFNISEEEIERRLSAWINLNISH